MHLIFKNALLFKLYTIHTIIKVEHNCKIKKQLWNLILLQTL